MKEIFCEEPGLQIIYNYFKDEKVKKKQKTNNIPFLIFSHKEDLDGIISAAIIIYFFKKMGYKINKNDLFLVNYNEIINDLKNNSNRIKNSIFIISDLGINPKLKDLYSKLVPLKTENNTPRLYIDHHKFPEPEENTLKIIKDHFPFCLNSIYSKFFENKKSCTADIMFELVKPLIRETENNAILIQNEDADLPLNISTENSNITTNKTDPTMTPPYTDYIHFNRLRAMAHLMDFSKQPENELENEIYSFAVKLKRMISVYQHNKERLKQLTFEMAYPKIWKDKFNKLTIEMDEIANIYNEELKKIIKNQISIIKNHKENHKEKHKKDHLNIYASISWLRPGEITEILKEKNPDGDLFIGLSWKEQYMNIRTKTPQYPIANIIAQKYNGGGHSNRAGFEIPEKFKDQICHPETKISDSSKCLFPKGLLSQIVNDFIELL